MPFPPYSPYSSTLPLQTRTRVLGAVTFYCATFVFGNVAFNVLFETIAHGRLFRPEVDAERIQGIRRSFRTTGLFYLAAVLIAPFAPWVALALNVAVRAYLLHIRYQSAKQAA